MQHKTHTHIHVHTHTHTHTHDARTHTLTHLVNYRSESLHSVGAKPRHSFQYLSSILALSVDQSTVNFCPAPWIRPQTVTEPASRKSTKAIIDLFMEQLAHTHTHTRTHIHRHTHTHTHHRSWLSGTADNYNCNLLMVCAGFFRLLASEASYCKQLAYADNRFSYGALPWWRG